jgi:hypothetical protein
MDGTGERGEGVLNPEGGVNGVTAREIWKFRINIAEKNSVDRPLPRCTDRKKAVSRMGR